MILIERKIIQEVTKRVNPMNFEYQRNNTVDQKYPTMYQPTIGDVEDSTANTHLM